MLWCWAALGCSCTRLCAEKRQVVGDLPNHSGALPTPSQALTHIRQSRFESAAATWRCLTFAHHAYVITSWHIQLPQLWLTLALERPCNFGVQSSSSVAIRYPALWAHALLRLKVWLFCRVPEECPQGVVDLWRSCIAYDPGARPSAAEVQAALEALLPLQRPPQSPPAPRKDVAAASCSGSASALRPCTPPQTHQGAAGASGAAQKVPQAELCAAGAVGTMLEPREACQGAASETGAALGHSRGAGALEGALNLQHMSRAQ